MIERWNKQSIYDAEGVISIEDYLKLNLSYKEEKNFF